MLNKIDSSRKKNTLTPKVHLLISVILTDEQLPGSKSNLNDVIQVSKVDQFLSTLHTISILPFSSADIYVQIEGKYSRYNDVVLNRVREVFPLSKISNYRLETYQHWVAAMAAIPPEADLIMLKTNHDHVYLPTSDKYFVDFAADLLNAGDRAFGRITHWPEAISRFGMKWMESTSGKIGRFSSKVDMAEGTCLVTIKLFREWWANDFTNGMKIVRPDNPFGPVVQFSQAPMLLPAMELFRHLDGYDHVGIVSPIASRLRPCCTLVDSNILHKDWIPGLFSKKSRDAEIPIPPPSGGLSEKINKLELILLASAYRINVRNLFRIAEPRISFKSIFNFIHILAKITTNVYFLSTIPLSLQFFMKEYPKSIYRKYKHLLPGLALVISTLRRRIRR